MGSRLVFSLSFDNHHSHFLQSYLIKQSLIFDCTKTFQASRLAHLLFVNSCGFLLLLLLLLHLDQTPHFHQLLVPAIYLHVLLLLVFRQLTEWDSQSSGAMVSAFHRNLDLIDLLNCLLLNCSNERKQ